MKGSIEPTHTYEAEQISSKLFNIEQPALKSHRNRKDEVFPTIFNLPVEQVLKRQVNTLNKVVAADEFGDTETENAFFVADLGEVQRQHSRWKDLLPRVEPYYGSL